MKLAHSQRGISIWVALVLVICLAIGGVIGLKLFPVYLESMKIDRGVSALLEEPDVGKLNKRKFKEALLRKLDIDSVTEINHNNFWDVVTMEKEGESITLEISYEVVVPIMGNVSALVDFQKTAQN